jgi:hypothetical protein
MRDSNRTTARRRLCALLVLLASCGDGSLAGGGVTVTGGDLECAFDGARRPEYRGTAEVAVAYRDVFGNAYERTFTRADAGIEIEPPVVDEAQTEPNPVHLSFGTVDQATDGAFIGNSAIPFIDPEDGVHFLLTYWSLTADCDRLSGTLSQNHQREGIGAVNSVTAQKNLGAGLGYTTWPFTMGDGTTLEATGGDGGVTLTVRGSDVEGILNFTITFTSA